MTFLNTAYLFQKIYDFFSGRMFFGGGDGVSGALGSSFGDTVNAFLDGIKPLLFFLCLLFLTGIIYSIIRTKALIHGSEDVHGGGGSHGGGDTHVDHTAHELEHSGVSSEATHGTVSEVVKENKRWNRIVEHINSDNQSDWRLAILECDIILEEILDKMGYRGESMSDKLKAIDRSDFLTIDNAWEAHRVRNLIAHEGSNFSLNNREGRRVVGLYETVFKEFHFL